MMKTLMVMNILVENIFKMVISAITVRKETVKDKIFSTY